jgi:hypothetical protein
MLESILPSGVPAQRARNGGLTLCFLQLALGLKRLSGDVLFVGFTKQLITIRTA